MASVGIIPRLPSVTNVDPIAVRESVVKAVTLHYEISVRMLTQHNQEIRS